MGRYQQIAFDESLFQVRTWLSSVHTTHMPLLILAGPHGRGKTTVLRTLAEQDGYPCLNLNLALSRALLDVLPSRLPTAIPDVLRELIGTSGEPLLLDNIELLFAPSLRLDPLCLLRDLSRLRPLVVAWPGLYRDGKLTYARPGHPEYRIYSHPDVSILPLGGEGNALS